MVLVVTITHNYHPDLREYLDKEILDICKEKNASPYQVFFCFYDNLWLVVLCYAMANQKNQIRFARKKAVEIVKEELLSLALQTKDRDDLDLDGETCE